MRIGIDAGGTFTDFIVLHDDGRLESFKIRSNPRAPHEVILAGLARVAAAAGAMRGAIDVVHGSTVATNALLERKGVRTAFVTTAGFEDLLLIGRQNRRELYNLTPEPESPIISAALSFGVNERSHFDGRIERRPSAAERKLDWREEHEAWSTPGHRYQRRPDAHAQEGRCAGDSGGHAALVQGRATYGELLVVKVLAP